MKVKGTAKVQRELEKLAKKYPGATAAALYEEGLAIDAASAKLVPVDTGRLRATHYTAPPRDEGKQIKVEIGYGTEYGLKVHEDMRARHTTGQAKFLEVPFKASKRGYASRVSDRIKKHVEKGTTFTSIRAAQAKGGAK